MNDKNTDFPQYRKLSNDRTFYKILDNRNFLEVQLMGSKKISYAIEAKQYPEMLKISEMLSCVDPYMEIDEIEFNTLFQ